MASRFIINRQLTRQSLPDDEYLYLLGIAMSVFASNNGFVIENIIHSNPEESWHDLIDDTSGEVCKVLKRNIENDHLDIVELFDEIIKHRNRIIHGFRITSDNNEQILATKMPKKKTDIAQRQFYITKEYLKEFIGMNEQLSDLLNDYRNELEK